MEPDTVDALAYAHISDRSEFTDELMRRIQNQFRVPRGILIGAHEEEQVRGLAKEEVVISSPSRSAKGRKLIRDELGEQVARNTAKNERFAAAYQPKICPCCPNCGDAANGSVRTATGKTTGLRYCYICRTQWQP